MKKKEKPIQGSLFPELEPQQIQISSKKTAKQINEELNEKIRQQQATIEAQQAEMKALKVKADAFDDLVKCRNLFPIGTIAKAFGRTAEWMNKYLEKKGIQFRRGNIWTLYSKYDSCGYTGVGWYAYAKDDKGRDLVRAHTYWTVRGMAFIREQLIKDGYWQD